MLEGREWYICGDGCGKLQLVWAPGGDVKATWRLPISEWLALVAEGRTEIDDIQTQHMSSQTAQKKLRAV